MLTPADVRAPAPPSPVPHGPAGEGVRLLPTRKRSVIGRSRVRPSLGQLPFCSAAQPLNSPPRVLSSNLRLWGSASFREFHPAGDRVRQPTLGAQFSPAATRWERCDLSLHHSRPAAHCPTPQYHLLSIFLLPRALAALHSQARHRRGQRCYLCPCCPSAMYSRMPHV